MCSNQQSTHLGSNGQPTPGQAPSDQQPTIQQQASPPPLQDNGRYAGVGRPVYKGNQGSVFHAYYQGQRLSSGAFSPGYGFRAPHPGCDHLPRPEELVTSEGAVHRVCPAPAPLCPSANADEGWEEEKTMIENPASTTPSPFIEVVLDKASALQMPRQFSHPLSPPPTASVTPYPCKQQQVRISDPKEREAPPHLASKPPLTPTSPETSAPATGKTAYVAWPSEGVQVTDPDKAMDELARLFEQLVLRPALAPRQGDGPFQGRRPTADQGYLGRTDRGMNGGTHDNEHVVEPQNNGWDSQPSRGLDGGDAGYSSVQGGNEGCRKCGEPGHFARECPQVGSERCFKCGDVGHMSRKCPKGGGNRCFNCGDEGHISRECGQERKPIGACHNCGEEGHQARACTEPQKFGAFRGNCNKCGERGHIDEYGVW
ncbi:hypothetical protein IAU59_007613 [Kwoniella sp. CBS 9459]